MKALEDLANIGRKFAALIKGSEFQVDVVASGLPEGAATAAKQLPDNHNVTVTSVGISSTLEHGQKTVALAGTAEALVAASTTLTIGVTVKALAGNTGYIYVGDSDVSSSNGFELSSGEEIFIPVDDLAAVYIDSSVNGEGVSFLAA